MVVEKQENNIEKEILDFLKNNGFENKELTEKEKLKIMKMMLFTLKVNLDYEEMRYTQNPITESATKEYMENISNINVSICKTKHYIYKLRELKKEKKKQKRKSIISSKIKRD